MAVFGALLGCAEKEPEDPRFVSDSIHDDGLSWIEFTDGRAVNIECIRIDEGGQSSILWREVVRPHAGGLGNTVIVVVGSELKIFGRGREPFARSINDFETGKIDHFTRGRDGSLSPSNIVWFCMLEGSSGAIPPEEIPTLPGDLEHIAAVSRDFSSHAIVLRASLAIASEL